MNMDVKAQTPELDMDIVQQFGVKNPVEMMRLMMQAQKALDKQAKENEKAEKIAQKEKDKMRPLKEVNNHFKRMRHIERALNMEKKMQKEEVVNKVMHWLRYTIEPYNAYLQGDKSNEVFRRNSRRMISLIKEIKGFDNLGVVTSSTRAGQEKFFVNTEFGIISGNSAREYLKYIIRTKTLKPMKEVCVRIFNAGINQGKKDADGANSMEDCYQQLSFFQLFNETALTDMVKQIVKESHDEGFARAYQRAACLKEFKLSTLPEEVKTKIIRDRVGGACPSFSDSEPDSDDEEPVVDDTDSDDE